MQHLLKYYFHEISSCRFETIMHSSFGQGWNLRAVELLSTTDKYQITQITKTLIDLDVSNPFGNEQLAYSVRLIGNMDRLIAKIAKAVVHRQVACHPPWLAPWKQIQRVRRRMPSTLWMLHHQIAKIPLRELAAYSWFGLKLWIWKTNLCFAERLLNLHRRSNWRFI